MLGNLKDSVKELSSNVKSAVAEKELEESDVEPLLEEFRLKLLKNNVSLEVAEEIESELHEALVGETVQRGNVDEVVQEALEDKLLDLLDDSFDLDAELEAAEDPPVVFLIGFNGSGKTTTAAKLASEYSDRGVVMGAGDTFRAASIEQLEEHGENLGVDVISHEYESDPAAVGYDTVEHAGKNGKMALVDTAGRSHSDTNLMDELQKMIEVNEPDVTFLIVDALAGNDVLEQADAYEGLFDAIIVTKMDVDEKGGAMISLSHRAGKPVAYIGTGQGYEDIREFDKEEFVESLFE
jgi:fused signal recognition particle receptor